MLSKTFQSWSSFQFSRLKGTRISLTIVHILLLDIKYLVNITVSRYHLSEMVDQENTHIGK